MFRDDVRETRAGAADRAQWGETALKMWAPCLKGLPAWNGRCVERTAAFNREWIEFLGRRLREDFTLPVQLAACKGPEDVWRTYAEFLRKMGDDYQAEMAELAGLGSAIVSETAQAATTAGRSREAD